MTMLEFKAWTDAGCPVTLADGTKAWLGCHVTWAPAGDGNALVAGHNINVDPRTGQAWNSYGSNIGHTPFAALGTARLGEVSLDLSGAERPVLETYRQFAQWSVKQQLA